MTLSLDVPSEHGVTERSRLESRKIRVPRVRVPAAGEHLLEIFWRLDGLRPIGRGYVGRIPPSEMESWLGQVGLRLSSWERNVLFAMDEARVRGPFQLDIRASRPSAPKKLTAAKFDEMFG